MTASEPRGADRPPSRVTPYCAMIVLACAAGVLAGWLFNIDALIEIPAGHVTTKANTAVAFVLSSLLLLIARRQHSAYLAVARWGLAAALLLLGLLTLAQYLSGVDLAIDQFIVEAPASERMTASPGRMAPTTAIGFILFAASLLADHWQSGVARGFGRTLATLLLLIAITSLLGYAYGVPELYLGIDDVTAMSPVTAVLFLFLAVGAIWIRAEFGFPALLVEDSLVGTHIRALLPMVVGVPLVVGAAVAAGYGRAYEGSLAIALTSLGSVVAASLVASISIVVLRRAEQALYIKDRALAAISSGVVITDHRGHDEPVTYVNKAFSTITGYAGEDMLGRNCRILNTDTGNSPELVDELRRHVEFARHGLFELRNRRKDGSIFWNRLSLAPVADYEGEVTHLVGVMDDITEERDQQLRLQSALENARQANAMRDSLVRLISHELRTPLNAALTWIRLMEVDNSESTQAQGLEVVAQSIDSQSRLIDDLVDVNRFASSGVRLESEVVDVSELVRSTVDELRPMIEAEQTLSTDIATGIANASVDPLRIRQIVRNLVLNAHKYTPAGGRIEVRLHVDESRVMLTVSDSGRGLSADDIEHVFEPFWRGESHQPGLGVGLTIVSALVEAHGGTIEVSSDGYGLGSTFTVRLPLAAPQNSLVTLGERATAARANTEGGQGP